jgi:hypothetical protein
MTSPPPALRCTTLLDVTTNVSRAVLCTAAPVCGVCLNQKPYLLTIADRARLGAAEGYPAQSGKRITPHISGPRVDTRGNEVIRPRHKKVARAAPLHVLVIRNANLSRAVAAKPPPRPRIIPRC